MTSSYQKNIKVSSSILSLKLRVSVAGKSYACSEWFCRLTLWKPCWHFMLWAYLCCCLIAKWCSALCESMDCIPPGPSVRGMSQARILEWVAISFSRDLPDPGIEPGSLVSPVLAASWILYHWATKEAQACLYHSINSPFGRHLGVFVTIS